MRKMRRRRRSEEEDEEAEEQSNYIVEELGRIRKGKLKRKKNPCRRKPLHVNFAAINYDQWIIAPPTYEVSGKKLLGTVWGDQYGVSHKLRTWEN